MATASFLASRVVPTGGFWVALAGGVALARAAERRGARQGYGASFGAMLETVAIMGPARFGIPLTQALSAPLLGRLEARGAGRVVQVLACAAIRLLHNTATSAFFIFVIAGGIDPYTGTYNKLAERIPLLPEGTVWALGLTGAGLVGWAAFASTVQVLVYRRGLRSWPPQEDAPTERLGGRNGSEARGFDPRAIAVAAALAFGVLLASTAWPVLAAVAAWLVVAALASRGDGDVVPAGLLLVALLGGGALLFGVLGGLGFNLALRRAARAALLVLVATWLRAAAGAGGLREVSRRALAKLGRVPSMREAAAVLDDLGAGRELARAGRSLIEALRGTPRRPMPVVDAVLGWVASESVRFRPVAVAERRQLSLRARDLALVVVAAVPLALAAGAV